MNIIKKFSLLIISALITNISFANTCPSVDKIHRANNQYRWFTDTPGWYGYFASPQSQGKSYKINNFLRAKWIKFYDSPDSRGYIECTYQGNINSETIIFTQSENYDSSKPTSLSWSCQNLSYFPAAACNCSNDSINSCEFK